MVVAELLRAFHESVLSPEDISSWRELSHPFRTKRCPRKAVGGTALSHKSRREATPHLCLGRRRGLIIIACLRGRSVDISPYDQNESPTERLRKRKTKHKIDCDC